MLSAALRSPGCLGGGLVGTESDDKRWQIECRFLDEESLVSWERSDSYARWGRYMQRFAAKMEIRREFGNTSLGQATEAAMAPVGDAPRSSSRSPKRPKRVVVGVTTFVIVSGAVLAINRMALPFLSDISPVVRIVVLAVVVTGVAIWVVPPMLGRSGGSAQSAPQIGAPRTKRSAAAKQKAAKAEEKAREKEAAAPSVGGRRRLETKASDTRETLEPVGPPTVGGRGRRRRADAEPELVKEPELIREPEPVRAPEPVRRPEPVPARRREPELVTDRVSVPVGPPTDRTRRRQPVVEPELVRESPTRRATMPVGPAAAGPNARRTPPPNLPPAPRREPQDRPVVPLTTPRGGFFPTSPHRTPTTRER
jgi:antibiotic biosynthesis monooxygenase (ABM) superfamily enzyme